MPGSDSDARALTLVLSDRAATELAEAVAWYEDRRAGLGLELLDTVDTLQVLLLRHPELGIEVRPRIRRAPTMGRGRKRSSLLCAIILRIFY